MLQVVSHTRIKWYYASLATFVASLGVILFTLVEMRRGILFPLDTYRKLGSPSTLLYFDPWHLPLLLVGALGAWLSYRWLTRLEGGLQGRASHLKRLGNILALALMAAL